MRWRGIVGVVASSLAVAVAGAGSAVAQTPVKPAEDTPKAEQPKPEQPKPEQPKPAEQEPKAPAPEPAKPEPKAETPKPEKPKPAQKQPAEPKPAKPKPAKQEPVRAEAGAPSAQAPAPAPAPAAVVAKTSLPRPARSVDASRVRHVNATESAPKRRHRAARDPGGSAGVERSHVRAAADVERPDPVPMRHSADATPATTRAWAAPPMHASRPEPVAASVERRQPRMLALDSSQTAFDVTLLLAIGFTTGIALLLGRHARRELW